MLDHISLAVADFERVCAFYDQVPATLGHRRVMEITAAPDLVAAGYGASEHYHANHYASFVIDPDGHHIEAVSHRPG